MRGKTDQNMNRANFSNISFHISIVQCKTHIYKDQKLYVLFASTQSFLIYNKSIYGRWHIHLSKYIIEKTCRQYLPCSNDYRRWFWQNQSWIDRARCQGLINLQGAQLVDRLSTDQSVDNPIPNLPSMRECSVNEWVNKWMLTCLVKHFEWSKWLERSHTNASYLTFVCVHVCLCLCFKRARSEV